MKRLARWFLLGTLLLIGACSGKKETPPTPEKPKPDAYEQRLADLLDAAEKGQLSRVTSLLKEGANVSDKNESGETVLMRAAEHGQTNVVKMLVELSRNSIFDRDKKGRSALMLAAGNGHFEAVKQIRGAFEWIVLDPALTRVQYESLQDGDGRTAIMRAAMNGHADIVTELLALRSLKITTESLFDKDGRTDLMLAAMNGHEKAVRVLVDQEKGLNRGDYIRLKDKDGKTAFDLAEKYPKIQAMVSPGS